MRLNFHVLLFYLSLSQEEGRSLHDQHVIKRRKDCLEVKRKSRQTIVVYFSGM